MTDDSKCLPKDADGVIRNRYLEYVQPFWKQNVVNGYLSGNKGIQIAYAYVINPAPVGSIAISSGRIESLIKYKELVFNLYNAGYSVFIHDHRGQGLSQRLTTNPHQGHIESFEDYVDDFKLFYDMVIDKYSERKPYLLCHSMGGAIGALYLLKYPIDFAKCALSAPMFGIKPSLPDWFARMLIHSHIGVNRLISQSPWYFLGQGNYQSVAFADNVLTHSKARYELFRQEYQNQPDVQLGGVTNSWLCAALDAMQNIYQNAKKISIPILLLRAEEDSVVCNVKQQQVAAEIPNCHTLVLPAARHELLMETDDIRDQCLREIFAFYQVT